MASAAYGYLGVGVETVAGTSVAPTKFITPKSMNFDIQQDEIVFREIAGSRQAQQSFGGSIRPSVTFDTAVYPSGAYGVILRGLFGTESPAAALVAPSTTAYLHTFADSDVLPSLSFERSDSRGAGGLLHERIAGCKIESASFGAEFGSEVTLSVTAQGLSMPEDPALKPASFPVPAMDPFIFTGVSVDIDGVPSDLFRSINFDFNNTIEPQEALRGVRTAYRLHEGPLECTLNGTVIYEDNDLRNKFLAAEEFEVQVHFEGEMADETNNIPYSLSFTFPRVKVLNFDLNMEAEGVMEADVEFTVSFDRTLNKYVTVEMVNLDDADTYET
jgi:hypothetical protein